MVVGNRREALRPMMKALMLGGNYFFLFAQHRFHHPRLNCKLIKKRHWLKANGIQNAVFKRFALSLLILPFLNVGYRCPMSRRRIFSESFGRQLIPLYLTFGRHVNAN